MDITEAVELLEEMRDQSSDEYTEMLESLLHVHHYREYLGDENKLIPYLEEELIRQAVFIQENYEKVEGEDGGSSWEWKEE